MEKEARITSVELVDIINVIRKEEGNKAELLHKSFMAKIDKELEIMEELKISQQNILPSDYTNARGKKYSCYSLNRSGMLQMLNSESATVRIKTIQYIEKLEEKVKQVELDYNKMSKVAISSESLKRREYEHDVIHYAVNHIEKRLLECDYTNIVATTDKIVNVHINMYVKDRYKAHQDTDKYGFKGDIKYVNHIKGFVEGKLDKIKPKMTMIDSNINSIMIGKARQLHKEIEASRNISDGIEKAELKRKIDKVCPRRG